MCGFMVKGGEDVMLVYPYIIIFITYCIIAELMQNYQEDIRISWMMLAIGCMFCSTHPSSCMRLMIELLYLLSGILAYTYGAKT